MVGKSGISKYMLVAVIAVLLAFILKANVPAVTGTATPGVGSYNINILTAPVATGGLLQFLGNVLGRSFIGASLRRILLNDNGVVNLRELATKLRMEPLHFPMRVVSKEAWDASDALAKNDGTSFDNLVHTGLKNHPNHDVRWRSVMDYHEAFKSGILKPSDVMNNTLNAVGKWDKEHSFYMFSSLKPDEVMKQAYESDMSKGAPLSVFDGVPVAFKDMMDIAGHLVYDGRSPKESNRAFCKLAVEDDIMVTRFRAVGAIIMGLTIMTEGGTSPLGYNSHFQGPVSPYSWNRYGGGSSSGSAVAVATGIVPVAIGYDGGGSIRLPASMSGIHGLAATFGRLVGLSCFIVDLILLVAVCVSILNTWLFVCLS